VRQHGECSWEAIKLCARFLLSFTCVRSMLPKSPLGKNRSPRHLVIISSSSRHHLVILVILVISSSRHLLFVDDVK
jgi:hypothetical protein